MKLMFSTVALIFVMMTFFAQPPGRMPFTKDNPQVVEFWLPLYVGPITEVVSSEKVPSWEIRYAKQWDHVSFKLCGNFQGHGEVALTYPEAGDPYRIDFDDEAPFCLITPVNWGGGNNPHQLQIYMVADNPAEPITLRYINIFVLNRQTSVD